MDALTTPDLDEFQECEVHYPRRYTIVATLGDQRATITSIVGLRPARKFVGRLGRKYPTEAVWFDIVRNPRPATIAWKTLKSILRAIVESEGGAP